ncbi:hypothetical protein [Microbacterium lacticum]
MTNRPTFRSADILACVRVDLTRPDDRKSFQFGEVGRRLYRATAGIPAGVVVQIVVSAQTPAHDLQLPEDATRFQIVAPDAKTLRNWLDAVEGARA